MCVCAYAFSVKLRVLNVVYSNYHFTAVICLTFCESKERAKRVRAIRLPGIKSIEDVRLASVSVIKRLK